MCDSIASTSSSIANSSGGGGPRRRRRRRVRGTGTTTRCALIEDDEAAATARRAGDGEERSGQLSGAGHAQSVAAITMFCSARPSRRQGDSAGLSVARPRWPRSGQLAAVDARQRRAVRAENGGNSWTDDAVSASRRRDLTAPSTAGRPTSAASTRQRSPQLTRGSPQARDRCQTILPQQFKSGTRESATRAPTSRCNLSTLNTTLQSYIERRRTPPPPIFRQPRRRLRELQPDLGARGLGAPAAVNASIEHARAEARQPDRGAAERDAPSRVRVGGDGARCARAAAARAYPQRPKTKAAWRLCRRVARPPTGGAIADGVADVRAPSRAPTTRSQAASSPRGSTAGRRKTHDGVMRAHRRRRRRRVSSFRAARRRNRHAERSRAPWSAGRSRTSGIASRIAELSASDFQMFLDEGHRAGADAWAWRGRSEARPTRLPERRALARCGRRGSRAINAWSPAVALGGAPSSQLAFGSSDHDPAALLALVGEPLGEPRDGVGVGCALPSSLTAVLGAAARCCPSGGTAARGRRRARRRRRRRRLAAAAGAGRDHDGRRGDDLGR